MKATVKKGASGKGQRLIIKGFLSIEAAHKFLDSQDNNDWQPNSFPNYLGHLSATADLKPGTYAFAGGRWHNVKSLDPSVLCHI